jgi:hypothetical protein
MTPINSKGGPGRATRLSGRAAPKQDNIRTNVLVCQGRKSDLRVLNTFGYAARRTRRSWPARANPGPRRRKPQATVAGGHGMHKSPRLESRGAVHGELGGLGAAAAQYPQGAGGRVRHAVPEAVFGKYRRKEQGILWYGWRKEREGVEVFEKALIPLPASMCRKAIFTVQ